MHINEQVSRVIPLQNELADIVKYIHENKSTTLDKIFKKNQVKLTLHIGVFPTRDDSGNVGNKPYGPNSSGSKFSKNSYLLWGLNPRP